jgi:prepilin-type N-terminal cleavage/methylation domain-containing protein
MGGPDPRGAPSIVRAFSLIELLVVVAVIALLVAVIAPALSGARGAARAAACVANLRTLSACWSIYTQDYAAFPCGRLPDYQRGLRFGWGGVGWYGDDAAPGILTLPDRPLNPYVLSSERVNSPAAVFKCPSDNGGYLSVSRERSWDIFGAGNASGEGDRTCYGLAGTSFEINTWMYCVPVAPAGWGYAPVGALPPRFRSNQNYAQILAEPSRFIVIGEIVTMSGGRLSRAELAARDIFTGAWHGDGYGQFGFADGSARRERVGAVTTPRYTFYMTPWKYDWTSWRWPDLQR